MVDDDAPTRLSLRIRGRVQGVGFSAAIRKQARALGLRGWVRDEQDGSVTVVVEGSHESLVALRSFCDEGTPFARVDQVEAVWSEATGEFPGFDLRMSGR